jgi:hypothetical protein
MLYIPPMPTLRHGDATIHYEEFGQGFPKRVTDFLVTHTPRGS